MLALQDNWNTHPNEPDKRNAITSASRYSALIVVVLLPICWECAYSVEASDWDWSTFKVDKYHALLPIFFWYRLSSSSLPRSFHSLVWESTINSKRVGIFREHSNGTYFSVSYKAAIIIIIIIIMLLYYDNNN